MFMGSNTSQFMKWAEAYFILYILLQPFLDLTAFLSLPLSEPVRVLSMVLGAVYIALTQNAKAKKYAIGYIGLLALVMVASFVNNVIFKDPFTLSIELVYMFKTVYFIMMLITYYFVFRSLSRQTHWKMPMQRYVFFSMSVIGVVMVLASLTGTGKSSYEALAKEGHSGWFFSGNELSAILGMGFAVMILYFMKKYELKTKLYFLPLVLSAMYGILTVGTKVALGSLVVILAVGTLIAWFDAWKKKQWANAIILPILLALTFAAVPVTAIGNNLGFAMEQFNKAGQLEEGAEGEGEGTGPTRGDQAKELLSNRNEFFNKVEGDYVQANVSQKVLGMGRGGNYEDVPKLIEMDFFDWFFNFGVLGFIILIIPILYFGYAIIKHLIVTRFQTFNSDTILIGLAVGLGLGTAFMAGHVLSSPASGIYLAVFIAYLYRLTKPKKHEAEPNS
ncbi:O-antigen ligase family protein [Halobacillus salinarum]|uniref:O-antigen ligase family protein n=1 Tax=Halobacillus salinarum TaxID=2932257 RepID=A0ABY4EU88_9BACI|nr:O-antigen ligase family protein [Halobacillus salinarum]UOQ45701.1 O-antigen ligase family protein [Halobacillus salinarum]